MNTTPDTETTPVENASTSRGEAPAPTTASAAIAATGGNDIDSIMRKMAEQQNQISSLNEQLETKSQDVKKLSEKQRSEMKHIYDTVISKWVDGLDTTNAKSREEFKSGLCRLAENAEQENGIWQVIMSASAASQTDKANAMVKETEFQTLTQNYNELKTRVGGGRFSDESARIGSKRAATDDAARPVNDIWDNFSSFMKTSYNNDSFAPIQGFGINK
jgi:hypothetical protein